MLVTSIFSSLHKVSKGLSLFQDCQKSGLCGKWLSIVLRTKSITKKQINKCMAEI